MSDRLDNAFLYNHEKALEHIHIGNLSTDFLLFKTPEVVTGNQKLKKFLKNHVPVVNRNYWPALFHWEGRLQSILGLTRRVTKPGKLPYERHLFKLSDGGELGLDFLEPESVGIKVAGNKYVLSSNCT